MLTVFGRLDWLFRLFDDLSVFVLLFVVLFVGFNIFEFCCFSGFWLDTGCVCGGLDLWVLVWLFLSRCFRNLVLLTVYSSLGSSAFYFANLWFSFWCRFVNLWFGFEVVMCTSFGGFDRLTISACFLVDLDLMFA